MLGVPVGIVAERAVEVVAHAVGLDVGFVIDIESEGIAELVELARLGIMAGADGVDIGRPHQGQVLQDLLSVGIVACRLAVFVEVDALELDGLAVHEEAADRALVTDRVILDFEAAEAHVEAGIFIADAKNELVEIRCLGAPRADLRDAALEGGGVADRALSLEHKRILPVQQLPAEVGDVAFDPETEKAVGEGLVEGGDDAEVPKRRPAGFTGEIDVAFDAADAPEVLTFEIGARAVAVNLQEEVVLAFPDIWTDVIAGKGLGILAVAHFAAVDIDIDTRFRRGEIEIHAPAGPLRRYGELPVVDTAGNNFRQGRRLRILRAEVVGLVGIDGDAIALYLPVSRHPDAVP